MSEFEEFGSDAPPSLNSNELKFIPGLGSIVPENPVSSITNLSSSSIIPPPSAPTSSSSSSLSTNSSSKSKASTSATSTKTTGEAKTAAENADDSKEGERLLPIANVG